MDALNNVNLTYASNVPSQLNDTEGNGNQLVVIPSADIPQRNSLVVNFEEKLLKDGALPLPLPIPNLPKPKGSPHPISTAPWSEEEDEAIWHLSKYYAFNWTLISQSIRAMKVGSFMKRNAWDCHNRFIEIRHSYIQKPEVREYLYAPPVRGNRATLTDHKKKALDMITQFARISKLVTPRLEKSSKYITIEPATQVNTCSHGTHRDTLMNQGITKLLTPSEISQLKEARERHAIEQSRLQMSQQVRPPYRPGQRPQQNLQYPMQRTPIMTNDASQQSIIRGTRPPASHEPQRMQAVSTTAAFVALNNAKTAAKVFLCLNLGPATKER